MVENLSQHAAISGVVKNDLGMRGCVAANWRVNSASSSVFALSRLRSLDFETGSKTIC